MKLSADRNQRMAERATSQVTNPTIMAEGHATSMVEEMRKTGTLSQREKEARLEEIVQEAA